MTNSDRGASPRPESTIVQNFAADLDDMFGLSGLSQTVNEKKQVLSTKDRELQELEARIREAEERLARASRNASPARPLQQQQSGAQQQRSSSPLQQPSQAIPTHLASERQQHPLAQKPTYPADRPPTQRQDTQTLMSGMPGHLPQTPVRGYSGSSEYVMVDGGARMRGSGTSVG